MSVDSSSSSYLLEALGWHITGGHADWLESGEALAGRDDVCAAYTQLDSLIDPYAQYRITGLMDGDQSQTDYTPVNGGIGARLMVSGLGISVEAFEVCVQEEAEYGLVERCDCRRCDSTTEARSA